MFTILGFTFGFVALGVVAAVVNVLIVMVTIAIAVYGSLAFIGVVVFSVIGIRRRTARRRGAQNQPQLPHAQGAYNPAGR